jgi:dTDP-4-amino-4,6-dideoxygalactose transaminase
MNKNLLIDHNLKINDYKLDIEKIFKSNSFTQGKINQQFKNKLKKKYKIKNCFLLSSATTAMSICLEVLGIKKGDEVAISDYSWISTAHVVENLGAKPIFIDVDKDTFNMSVADLKYKITKKTKSIIFVHSFGNPSNVEEIKKIADDKSIPLIEDAACAIGSKIKNKYVGQDSLLACFSFHQRKVINTGEGGAIFSNNKRFSQKIEKKLLLGSKKIKNKNYIDFDETGHNYRLSEIQCLLGSKQLDKLNKKILTRNKIYKKYSNFLKKYNFIPQKINNNCSSNIQSCTFVTPPEVDRDFLIKYLKKNNIDSTIGTYSLSNSKYYKKKYSDPQKNSYFLFKNCISFPCHENVNLKYIFSKLEFFLK